VHPDGFAVDAVGVAAVDQRRHWHRALLVGRRAAAALGAQQGKDGLHGGGCQHADQFRQVRAAMHAAQPCLDLASGRKKKPAGNRRFEAGGVGFAGLLPVSSVRVPGLSGRFAALAVVGA
jgi:hypothetical protein